MNGSFQQPLFDDHPHPGFESEDCPAYIWDQEVAKRALDELFILTCHYRSSRSFQELMQFVARFRFYSPYNAMLIHTQMPGARFVAPPHRWERDYGRIIKPGVRPIVILQPMGPVMFVYDVSDTETTKWARDLPREVEHPFETWHGVIGGGLEQLTEGAKRDGLRVTKTQDGSQSAGSICPSSKESKATQDFFTGYDEAKKPQYAKIPVKYELLVNGKMSREAQYATIVHELAHLYCGHMGTPNKKWWPDRRGLRKEIEELEAESVAFLVCSRLGIDNPSDEYLAGYLKHDQDMPSISMELIIKNAGLIETMSRERMKIRK